MTRLPLALVVVGLLLAPRAEALLASCTASSTGVAFGSYNPIAATPTYAGGNVAVTCSGLGLLVSYTVLLSGGGSGNVASRRMNAGARLLPYNVYTSAAYTTVWDNVTGVSGGFLIGLGSTTFNHPVYGRILAQQPAPAGSYSDSLVITVNY
ncbi:MAG: spore coat U domain-containing protein [Gammaproteobacteria bacterium]|nr:spore coat U domain-containing protein [Gammaproteobacteria bacterium]